MVFFLLFHSVFVSKRPLRDGDFEGASWLLFLSTQRSWCGFGRLPGRERFFLKFPYWLFMNYGTSPGSHRGTEGMAMAAPPCCPRPFALDREVKVDVCRTSYVVPLSLCPCTVMNNRISSRPQPMGSGGDATPAKSQGRARDCTFFMCRVSFKRSEDRARLVRSLNS